MSLEFRCGSELRRSTVRDHPTINGIDYLEVRTLQLPDKTYPNPLLIIHCFKKVSGLGSNNVLIQGGVRVKNVVAEWAYDAKTLAEQHPDKLFEPDGLQIIKELESPESVLVARASSKGDFSTYMLRLVNSFSEPEVHATGFDEILSSVEFSFKMECPSDFDCACKETEQQEFEEPPTDYMAKDYSSFRKLVMDRLSLIMPDWKERNPADIGVMLVELLAYTGDHLSYYQDAVSTEAYLGTARKRISARRHARLLDYYVDEGCNSRAWVCFKTSSDGLELKKGVVLLTAEGEKSQADCMLERDWNPIAQVDPEVEIAKGSEAFETMYDVTLYKDKHKMSFYTWGETDCWLPQGSTSATLKNDKIASVKVFLWEDVPGNNTELFAFLQENFAINWLDLADVTKSGTNITVEYIDDKITIELEGNEAASLYINNRKAYEFDVEEKSSSEHVIKSSSLNVGDVLLFEEILSPSAGSPPDSSHRHAVRLTSVSTTTDELTGEDVLEIIWNAEDALPFALCLAKHGQEISVARGNIVLADHGYTIKEGEQLELAVRAGRYYPRLARKPLTHAGPPFDGSYSAKSAHLFKTSQVVPTITLVRKDDPRTWEPQRDLLSSDDFAAEFVVESETDGASYIRFDNRDRQDWADQLDPPTDKLEEPTAFRKFTAMYRIGNGEKGNVGSCSITRILEGSHDYSDITGVTNPMAASGGRDPETIESVRQHAPQAFRRQERAVTEDDYTEVLKRHPQVQNAIAARRWTGSWYTMFVTVDRLGGLEMDSVFENEIVGFLEKYRLAGYDLEINGPIYVPLQISLDICIKDRYFKGEVLERLVETFSNRVNADGKRGFFHPDNFTFGQPLYLSRVYEAAMAVDGVSSVRVTTFQRWAKVAADEIKAGVIRVEHTEIVRLDNDPSKAENGMIEFTFCKIEEKEEKNKV
jgi:hypothetical protein